MPVLRLSDQAKPALVSKKELDQPGRLSKCQSEDAGKNQGVSQLDLLFDRVSDSEGLGKSSSRPYSHLKRK